MQLALIIALALHVLSGVFWAGSTFTLARTGGAVGERLFWPQIGAAVIAVLTGGYLWTQFHGGGFGTMEKILAVGIFCAFAAAGAQGAIVGSAARKFSTSEIDENVARSRITVAQRIAAALLAVTIVCMAVARYV